MTIIVQPKRILIKDFYDDEAMGRFIKYNTITDMDMYFNISKEWTALYETIHDDEPVLAIPRRFPLEILHKFTNTNDFEKDSPKLIYSSREIELPHEARDEEQKILLDFLLGNGEYKNIVKKPRRGLFAATGKGKTFSTLKAISEEKHFAFINCPSKNAIMTWKQEIAKFTNIEPKEIIVLEGKHSLEKIIKKKDEYKIILGSSKTFSSLIHGSAYDAISNFFDEMQFSLIVHDEAHLNIQVMFFIEMMSQSKRTYYLTATPSRRLYKEHKLLENLLPSDSCMYIPEVVPRFIVRECIYYSNPKTADDIKGVNKPRSFDYLTYSKRYLLDEKKSYREPYLNDIFKRVLNAARKALTDKEKNKVAIICKTKLENEIFYAFIKEEFPDLTIGVYNSDIPDADERFKETEAQIIISTDQSFAGIINIVALEAIVLIHPTSSESRLLQILGRNRQNDSNTNKKNLVFIMSDFSFKRCKKTMYSVKSILEEHSLSYKRIELNQPVTVNVQIESI